MKKGIPELEVNSAAAVAAFFDVSRRTVEDWKTKGMPVRGERQYEVGEIARWRASFQKRDISDSDIEKRLKVAETRKTEAAATVGEVRAKRAIGEVMETRFTVAALGTMAAMVRARLQAIPGEMASSFPPEIRHDLMLEIEQKISLALIELANQGASSKEFNAVVREIVQFLGGRKSLKNLMRAIRVEGVPNGKKI